MKAVIASSVLALALVGCNNTQGLTAANNQATSQVAPVQYFLCENDAKPAIRVINDNQIQLTVDEETTTLNIAPSGSGALYVSQTGIYGNGGSWHQKGDMAIFEYNGYGSPTTCQLQ